MYRVRQLAVVVTLSWLTATASFGQPIPAPPMIPAVPMPASVGPSDSASGDAKKVPTILNGLPLVPAPGDDELRQLLIARYNAALGEYKSIKAAFDNGTCTITIMNGPVERMCRVGLELSDKPTDQIAIYERLLVCAKQNEAYVKGQYVTQSRGGEADKMYGATYLRLDAEIQLLRAKRNAGLAK